MTQKSIKYHIIVRHLLNFEKGHRKTTYTRIVSSYDNLDDAIVKLSELSLQKDPTIKGDIPVIIGEIKRNPRMLMVDEYSVVFEEMNDFMPEERKWYRGPGAVSIEGSLVN